MNYGSITQPSKSKIGKKVGFALCMLKFFRRGSGKLIALNIIRHKKYKNISQEHIIKNKVKIHTVHYYIPNIHIVQICIMLKCAN